MSFSIPKELQDVFERWNLGDNSSSCGNDINIDEVKYAPLKDDSENMHKAEAMISR